MLAPQWKTIVKMYHLWYNVYIFTGKEQARLQIKQAFGTIWSKGKEWGKYV